MTATLVNQVPAGALLPGDIVITDHGDLTVDTVTVVNRMGGLFTPLVRITWLEDSASTTASALSLTPIRRPARTS